MWLRYEAAVALRCIWKSIASNDLSSPHARYVHQAALVDRYCTTGFFVVAKRSWRFLAHSSLEACSWLWWSLWEHEAQRRF